MNMSYCVWTVLVCLIYRATSQCTFPSSLQGQWLRSRDTKTLSFTSPSSVTGFNLESKKQTVDEFTCYITEGSKYVLRSERYNNILPNTYIYIYICYDMVAVESKAFYIYEISERTSEINNNERGAVFSDNIPVTLSDICTLTRNDVQYTTLVSIAGLASNSITYCPDILLGAFNYTQEALVSKCTGTSTLTACNNRVSISADHTGCSGDYFGYSVEGYLLCTATLQFSTVTYVTLYNTDSTVDGSTSYRFSCLAIERSGNELLMTQYPTDCELGQSGTSVSSPGFKFTLQPKVLCPIPNPTTTSGPSTGATVDDDNIPLIVGVLVGVIFLLALILIIILCIRAKKRKKAKVADSKESSFRKEKQQNGRHPQDRNKANSPTSTNGAFILPNNNKGESNLHIMDENENDRKASDELLAGTKRTKKPPELLPGLSPLDDKPRTNITKSMSPQVTAAPKNRQQTPINGEVKNATSSQLNHTSSSLDYKNHTDSNFTSHNTTNVTESWTRETDIKTGQTNGSSKNSMDVNNDDVHGSGDTNLANKVTTLQNTNHVSAKNTTGILTNEDKGPSGSNIPENAPMISGQGAGVKSNHAQDDETATLATNVKALNREQASAKNAQGRQKNLDNSINKGPNGSDFPQNTPMNSSDKIKGGRGGNNVIQDHASADGGAILASNSAFLQNTNRSPTKNDKQSSLHDTSSNGQNGSGSHRNVSDDKTKGGDVKNGRNNDHTIINNGTISAAPGATVSKKNVRTSVTKNKGAQKKCSDSPKKGSNESNFHQNASGISVDKSTGDSVNNNSAKDQACDNNGINSAAGIPQQTAKNSDKNIQSKQNTSHDSSYVRHDDRTSLSSYIGESDNGEPVGKQQLENQNRRNKNGVLSKSDGIADHTSKNVNSSKTSPSISKSIDQPNVKSPAHASEAVIPYASSSMRRSCTSDTSTTKNASGSEVTKSQDTLNTFYESGFSTPISYDSEGASVIDEEQTRAGLSKRGASKKRRIKNKTDTSNHSSVYQTGASNIMEGLSGKFQMDRIKAAKKKKKRRHGVASKSKIRNKSQITSDSEDIDSDISSDFDVTEIDMFNTGSFHADGQEIIDRKESVISSVGPASCALISPKDNPTKKTSVISKIADGDTDTTKPRKKDQNDKSKSKKKKKKKK